LHIPVIGVIDTNSDPDMVDYGIPGNDDAIRAIELMCVFMADAVLAGKAAITNGEMAAEMTDGAPAGATQANAAGAEAAPAQVTATATDAPAEAADAPKAAAEAAPVAKAAEAVAADEAAPAADAEPVAEAEEETKEA
jgi:small subunit ribosomal protein S2